PYSNDFLGLLTQFMQSGKEFSHQKGNLFEVCLAIGSNLMTTENENGLKYIEQCLTLIFNQLNDPSFQNTFENLDSFKSLTGLAYLGKKDLPLQQIEQFANYRKHLSLLNLMTLAYFKKEISIDSFTHLSIKFHLVLLRTLHTLLLQNNFLDSSKSSSLTSLDFEVDDKSWASIGDQVLRQWVTTLLSQLYSSVGLMTKQNIFYSEFPLFASSLVQFLPNLSFSNIKLIIGYSTIPFVENVKPEFYNHLKDFILELLKSLSPRFNNYWSRVAENLEFGEPDQEDESPEDRFTRDSSRSFLQCLFDLLSKEDLLIYCIEKCPFKEQRKQKNVMKTFLKDICGVELSEQYKIRGKELLKIPFKYQIINPPVQQQEDEQEVQFTAASLQSLFED
ncbi:hypothetical protein ROZALSC1DRAFT_21692, partial [Rozella allomycis CSF55]